MADQALYRKYRSADFSEVIGQDHIVTTLISAIKHGRTSHAYLFTGPRGVGKTSVARLLARALNCTAKDGRPCNACPSCTAIINSSLDIVEIDAASNRSIDSVRDLRDKVALAPAASRYKVYIIDEVHMLTGEAFNALLKTLEEPPAHAVFILATTESHKVPDTIISRTQRFNFRPIGPTDLVDHLAKIAASEKVNVEAEALEIIAGAARGSFRDGISALDQIMASGQQPVTAELVRGLLGLTSEGAVSAVSRAIAASDARGALVALAEAELGGAQPSQMASGLTAQWRDIMRAAAGATEPTSPVVAELASAVGAARAAVVVTSLLEAARSPQLREALEAAVVLLTAAPAPVARPAASAGPVAKPAASAPATPDEPPAPSKTATKTGASPDATRWPKVVLALKQQSNSLAALVAMYPVEVSPGGITIKARYNFHRDLFQKPANRQLIEAVVQKVYGQALSVTAVIDETAVAAVGRKTTVDPNTELISSALEILGGEVVE